MKSHIQSTIVIICDQYAAEKSYHLFASKCLPFAGWVFTWIQRKAWRRGFCKMWTWATRQAVWYTGEKMASFESNGGRIHDVSHALVQREEWKLWLAVCQGRETDMMLHSQLQKVDPNHSKYLPVAVGKRQHSIAFPFSNCSILFMDSAIEEQAQANERARGSRQEESGKACICTYLHITWPKIFLTYVLRGGVFICSIYSNPDFYPIKKMGPVIEELSGWIVLLDAQTSCAELHHSPQDSSPGKELSKVGRRQ